MYMVVLLIALSMFVWVIIQLPPGDYSTAYIARMRLQGDVLSEEESREFLADLLDQFRVNDDGRWAFPFSPKAVDVLIKHISYDWTLTPRRIMSLANHVLTQHLTKSSDFILIVFV